MKYKYLFCTILFAIFILYFSLIPEPVEVKSISHSDKLLHFFSYFILSFLCFKSINNWKVSILLAGTYGLLIEIIQLFLPFRFFEVLDIITNYAGASLIVIAKMKR